MMKQNQQTKGKYKSGRLELAPGGKDKDNDPEIAIEFGPALAAALPADDTTATGGEMKAKAPPSGKEKQKRTRKRRKKVDDYDEEEEEVEEEEEDYYSTTQPGAVPVPGPGNVSSPETIIMGAETVTNINVDRDYTPSLPVTVKADLVPEDQVFSASTIDMKIERLETLRRNRYRSYLIAAVVFYVLSFLFDVDISNSFGSHNYCLGA